MALVIGETRNASEKKVTYPFVTTVRDPQGKILFETVPMPYTAPDKAERNTVRMLGQLKIALPTGATATAIEVNSEGKPVKEVKPVQQVKVLKRADRAQA